MLVLDTEITIDAPPQLVWSVLDDLESYPAWNEVLSGVKGPHHGRRIGQGYPAAE